MVNRNIFRPRSTPLVCSFDEVASIDLIMLADWLNLLRSSGFIGILGAQSLGYLEETYGKQRLDAIIGGCTTQFIFQLNDQRTAEYYVKQLGDKDVSYKLKSRSRGKDGSSNSTSENLQTRPLLEIQEIQQFPMVEQTTAKEPSNEELAKREMSAKLLLPLPEERQKVNALLQELASTY